MSQISTVIFNSPLLQIGLFRCNCSYPHFTNTGPVPNHLLVFPRTSVCIQHVGNLPIMATPNVVMFYNKNQAYHRYPVSPQGDWCEWFAFQPQVIIDAVSLYEPAVGDGPDTPFSFTHGPSDPHSYLGQRAIVEHICLPPPPDVMYVEATALTILEKTLDYVYGIRGQQAQPQSDKTKQAHQALVYEAQSKLATHFQEPLSLANIAAQLHTSVYHLCRIFRRYTGYTLQQYLDQIRLRTALDPILHENRSLASLAHELGYATHSHFTQAFRRSFGITPSKLRQSRKNRSLNVALAQNEQDFDSIQRPITLS